MNSRLDSLANLATEVDKYLKESKDDKLSESLYNILMRIHEAEKCLQDKEDSTGKPLTAKTTGHYLLKTFRITQEPNFNKFLVKAFPAHYRKLTQLFTVLDKLAQEILSYDYKKIRQAEADVRRIHQFLVKGENAFRTASQREKEQDKSSFLLSIANEMSTLISMIYLGKNKDNSLCTQQECIDRVSALWSKMEGIDWAKFVTDELHNPVFLLKESSDHFEEIFKNFIVKKFSAKRSMEPPGEKPRNKKFEEDVVHLEIDRTKPKTLTPKIGIAPVKKKKGIPAGPMLDRKGKPRTAGGPIHKPGIDELIPGFKPVKVKGEAIPEAEAEIEEEKLEKTEAEESQREEKIDVLTPVAPLETESQPELEVEIAPTPPKRAKPEITPKEPAVAPARPSLHVPMVTTAPPPKPDPEIVKAKEVEVPPVTPSIPEREAQEQPVSTPVAPQVRKAAATFLSGAKRAPEMEEEQPAAAPEKEKEKQKPALGRHPEQFFRTVEKTQPSIAKLLPPEPPPPPLKPKTFEEEVMELLGDKTKDDNSKLKGSATAFLSVEDLSSKPRSFLSASIGKDKPSTFLTSPKGKEKPRTFLSGEPEKAKPEPLSFKEHVAITEMLPPVEAFLGMDKKTEAPEEEKPPEVATYPEPEEEEEGMSIADAIMKAEADKKIKKKGCLPAFIGMGLAALVIIIKLVSLLVH